LLYALILHLVAGLVTGSVFKIKTLLLILSCVAAEFIGAAYLHGGQFALGMLANIVAIQVGYAGGLLTRLTVERSLDRTAKARTHRAP
jgi:hypothetical protein